MEAHLHMQPISPSTMNPLLSQGIDMTLLRALEKKPADRYAKATDFASAFERVIQPMAAPTMIRIG
jgi:serine/threonine-protein kinase